MAAEVDGRPSVTRPTWPARLRGRLGTVRVRTTLAAAAVVALALGLGAVALVAILHDTLTNEIRNSARLRAAELAVELESGTEPGMGVGGDEDDQVFQVLDERGDVEASSGNVAGMGPVARLRPGESVQLDVPIDDDPFVAVAVVAGTDGGPRTVVVARTIDTVLEATQAVTRLLAVGLPVLLILVVLTTWLVVGRALAPVDGIRREVDEISAAELHRRVPDPPGRDEIARLADTMNRMLGRLETAQARQRRFISDASHELRSPVASIRQHAEVALAHPDRTTPAELAETVLAEDLRVQRLVEDLLFLAKADEHTLQLVRRPVDVDDLVFGEARRLRDTNDTQVDTTAVSAGRVAGDAAGLRRVLRNLGDNAARHARGRVAFSLGEHDGAVVLVVDDDGPGIPESERGRILERFVRLDDARARDAGGSGLGLAIVSELVAAHGGRVTIGDSPLGGARIQVWLPAFSRESGSV